MMFPNAHEGVKKIYKSQILEMIGALLLFVAAIFAIVVIVAAQKGNSALLGGMAIALVLFSLAGAVLAVIGLIFYIRGINLAKADEPTFNKALICVLVSLGCSVLAAVFSKNTTVKSIFGLVQTIANLGGTFFIIQGISSLAKKLNRDDIVNHGKLALCILVGVYALQFIANLLAAIFAGSIALATSAGVISLVSSILSIVSFIVYLIFLKRSVKMLEA